MCYVHSAEGGVVHTASTNAPKTATAIEFIYNHLGVETNLNIDTHEIR